MKIILCIWLLCQLIFGFPIEEYAYPELDAGEFEGDIILTPGQRNGIKNTKYRWEKGYIPYLLDERYTVAQREVINEAFDMFHKNTCIRFGWKEPDEKDYIYINKDKNACSSRIGRIGGKQNVFLGDNCLGRAGTAAHELMHAVGFFHEQSRTDRDEYVIIEWDNIKPNQSHNFKVLDANVITPFGQPYDYGSILHYGPTAFSKNGEPTIIPVIPGVEIGQREHLSDIDINKINAMYKC